MTLLSGTSFIVCTAEGDIQPGNGQGYFASDTRLLNRLILTVDGERPRLVASRMTDPGSLESRSVVGGATNPGLLLTRTIGIDNGIRLTFGFENLTGTDRETAIDLTIGSDFADLFEVKRGVRARSGFVGSGPSDGGLVLAAEDGDARRGLRLTSDVPTTILRDGMSWRCHLAGRSKLTITVTGRPEGARHEHLPAAPWRPVDPTSWMAGRPRLLTNHAGLQRAWNQSLIDLCSLSLDTEVPGRPIIAAGSPWFMALFGRDSLITSWQSLPLGTDLALGSLAALAARQGRKHDPRTEEAPGKILHEVRAGQEVERSGAWGSTYYGSVDATPLFVVTLGAAWRWGAPESAVRALLDPAEEAVQWVLASMGGDDFLSYGGPLGSHPGLHLNNQGWKDSDDAVRHPDGTQAEGPIALVEVQGYVHGCLLAMADMREAFGSGDPAPLRERARIVAAAVERAFWLEDEGCYALAIDGLGKPVSSVASNAGHLLWTGTVDPLRARRLADRLMAPDCFNGFGIRTLSAGNAGFNPMSYHCGSVWPHDSSLIAAGLARYGLDAEACVLGRGMLDAADAFGGRLPELFGGFARENQEHPVPYPTSCSPQAWAAGAPIVLIRSWLGLDVDVPGGCIRLRPRIPEGIDLTIERLPVGRGHLSLTATRSTIVVDEAPAGMQVTISP